MSPAFVMSFSFSPCSPPSVLLQDFYSCFVVCLFFGDNNSSGCSPSIRSCQGFMHMKFTQCKNGKYVLGQNSPPFDSIPELVHFYTTHRLPIRGAEHLSLLFPVLVQTL